MLAARVVVKVSLGEEKKARTRNLRDAKDFVHDKRQEETAANQGKYSLILRRSRSLAVTHSLPSPSDGLH